VRVLLDTTYAQRAPRSGTGVYVQQIARALSELDDITVITTFDERRRPPAGGGAGSARNARRDQIWTQVTLPRRARAAAADVIHHPLPAHAFAAAVPQVVTVHDLAFELLPQHFATRYRRYAHLTHRAAARRAQAVIAVSEATAQEVHAQWGVAPERLVVARHGPGQALEARQRAQPPAHFLYVGDDEPRKHLGALLDAYRRYARRAEQPLGLMLAGSMDAGYAAGRIRVERDPSPGRLSELHAAAAALVHPSLDEGFGLTLLEAMALGTPVIAAASPAAREVCGDAARLVAPGDRLALADAMEAVAASPDLRSQLTACGRTRAALFSWQLAAQAHLRAYDLALDEDRDPRHARHPGLLQRL
jgi:glycosyltransferase involved in cell wall biosynthesis